MSIASSQDIAEFRIALRDHSSELYETERKSIEWLIRDADAGAPNFWFGPLRVARRVVDRLEALHPAAEIAWVVVAPERPAVSDGSQYIVADDVRLRDLPAMRMVLASCQEASRAPPLRCPSSAAVHFAALIVGALDLRLLAPGAPDVLMSLYRMVKPYLDSMMLTLHQVDQHEDLIAQPSRFRR